MHTNTIAENISFKLHCLSNLFMFLLLSLGVLGYSHAYAADVQNPVTMIQTMVNDLQTQMQGQKQDSQALYQTVKQVLIPHVATQQMAAQALGPKWRNISQQQREEFIEQFGLLLTHTYANALITINNYEVTTDPLRSKDWQQQQQLMVTGVVRSKSTSDSSRLTYYLERSNNTWKIYDLAIEGVSFLKNYQAQFQAYEDMDALLNKLKQLNSVNSG